MTLKSAQTLPMSNPAAAAAMMASLLALLYVAPLAAQGTASLLELLSNPKAEAMPALALAPSDGVMLAGRPLIPSLPRLTVPAQPGDALAKVAGQRLPGAVPQIIAPPRLPPGRALASVAAERLAPHYLNPESPPERAFLESILGTPLPDYLVKIEPAINAPRWEDSTAELSAPDSATAGLAEIALDQPWTGLAPTPVLAAMAGDALTLPEGFADVPPPPLVPQTLTAVVRELVAVSRIVPDALTPYQPNAAIPADRKMLEAVLGVPLPEPYATQAANPVILTGKDLDTALQTELIRVGCLKGKADGDFGSGSRGALELFFASAKIEPASADRSQAMLDQIVARPDQVCETSYAPPKAAPAATTKAPVTKPATQAPVKAAPPVKAPSKKDKCKANPEECSSNG